MITGRCLCGAAQYRSPGPALFSCVCHCRDCQRASGTGGVPVLGVDKTSFASSGPIRQSITQGGSGQPAIRNFCTQCGSLLFGTPQSAPGFVTIYAGSLDDPTLFEPREALFVGQRPPWARLAMQLVEHAAHPDSG
ncbi:GFA family protein [Lysobacter changpingensis]|uniref:GFA family protein n=1 Tax=Lysobacter changpingensis TaxID=2792784 RepID=UPI001A8C77D8|nr:GFA family protein [Lysobacter changpingensis]